MASVLTDIALQLKGNLSFLLGLGGMFTIVKGLLTGILVLRAVGTDRPSITTAAKRLRRRLFLLTVISLLLFVLALVLYFSEPIASIDPDSLRKTRSLLTSPQQSATAALAAIAVILVSCEGYASVLRYRFTLLAAKG